MGVYFLKVEWEEGELVWRRCERAFEGVGEEPSRFAGQPWWPSVNGDHDISFSGCVVFSLVLNVLERDVEEVIGGRIWAQDLLSGCM